MKMSFSVRSKLCRRKLRRMDAAVKGGVSISLLFSAIILILSLTKTCNVFGCEMRAVAFWRSPPNEIGDTLAGIAGALAFLWIIVTVMLQSKELAAQRAELKLTRSEFEKMAVSQAKQVELLDKQGKIFETEQRQRIEARAERLLNQQLESLRDLIERLAENSLIQAPGQADPVRFFEPRFRSKASGATDFTFFYFRDIELESYFARRLAILEECLHKYFLDSKNALKYEFNRASVEMFKTSMIAIKNLHSTELGPDQIERLKRLRIEEWLKVLDMALSQEQEAK